MRIEEKRAGETARDYSRRILKNNIVTMELVPGVMVSENELAAQMGLSRTPVREALMDLARECRVELPICETVYEIVHNHQDPKDQLTQLFMRSTK